MENGVGMKATKKCWCIECKKAYHKAYSAKWEQIHKLERLERQKTRQYKETRKAWAKKVNITEQRREYHRSRYQSNKAQMRLKMDEWRSKNMDKWNGYSRKRRALLKDASVAPYDPMIIYEQYGGICRLCNELIDLQIKCPNPKSFSIDHILPIALGGGDTPENVQPAHLGCNARKAHRV